MNTNPKLNPETTTIIDDGQFQFPVATPALAHFESLRGKLCFANYPPFCSAVPHSMPGVQVGSNEMIEECNALREAGAPLISIKSDRSPDAFDKQIEEDAKNGTLDKIHSKLMGERFDVLDYAASVRHAIKRSISHNEIVKTPVPAEGRKEMMRYLEAQDGIEGLDNSPENDGSVDVWGEFKGEDFRIRFTAE